RGAVRTGPLKTAAEVLHWPAKAAAPIRGPPASRTVLPATTRAHHEQPDEAGGVAGPGGPPQGDGLRPHARPVPPGPQALRPVLAPLQRHPARLLQEPGHRQDDVAAPRP